MSVKGMEINNILLTHGHSIPIIGKNINKIVTGHLHPILIKEGNILNGQKVWIRIILKKNEKESKNNSNDYIERKIEFIIIPHFNKYLNYDQNYSNENKIKGKKSKLPLLDNLITRKNGKLMQYILFHLMVQLFGRKMN